MKLKLQLTQDGKIIFEIPISPKDWPKETLKGELRDFEADFQKLSKIFGAMFQETRWKMMKRLIEEENSPMSFTTFMQDLDLNPKIVWENTKKLREGGLLEKVERGKYRCSSSGQSSFILISFAFKRLMETLEDIEENREVKESVI